MLTDAEIDIATADKLRAEYRQLQAAYRRAVQSMGETRIPTDAQGRQLPGRQLGFVNSGRRLMLMTAA